jgi:hypothetical protein
MQESFDLSDYALQVRKLSKALLCSGGGSAEISGRMHLLAVATERDLTRFGDSAERSHVACGPGCGACCVLNVTVLFPEAITITWFLRRRFSDQQLDSLRARLKDLLTRTRWLDDEERLFVRVPCAFLDANGSCLIHSVRPYDAVAMAPLEGAPYVEMNLFQKQFIDMVYTELAAALEELGLDHRPRRLSAAVLALLAEPGMVETFLSGGVVPIN